MSGKWICISFLVLSVMVQTKGYGQVDAGLVGWWEMEEFLGGVAVDSSGYENHGFLHGDPSWVSGVQGGALLLDGQDDYVDCGAHTALNVLSAVTIAAWIMPGDNNQDRKLAGNMSANGGFKLALYKNNKVEMAVRTSQGQVMLNRNISGGTVLLPGTWYHVVGIYSAQAQILQTYVNGQLDRSMVLNNVFMGIPAETFKMGRDSATDGYYFKGALDDVRVYNRALSPTDIDQLAHPGSSSNDDCQYAMPVGDVETLAFDTTNATFDGSGEVMSSPNIWYCYTAPGSGPVTVSLCGSHYDTLVAVYRGCSCDPGQRVLMAYNDDFCGLQSQLVFDAGAGESYLIEVGGYANRSGTGVLSIHCAGQTLGDYDLGDAPDSTNDLYAPMTAYEVSGVSIPGHFPTTFLGNSGQDSPGPLHQDPLSLAYLGTGVSLEMEAYKGADEDGINNIDPFKDVADKDGADDGLILPVRMPDCDWTSLDYTITVVDPNRPFWVNVWCDWNRDGDWDDDGVSDPNLNNDGFSISEWAVQNQYFPGMAPGFYRVATPGFHAWHPSQGPVEMWLRVTLSEVPWTGGLHPGQRGNAGSGPEDGYGFGETEDYLVYPDTGCTACKDLNDDGVIDINDLWVLLDQWLTNCFFGTSVDP